MGLLRDDDGKKGYDWSYNYTVIAWNNAQINAVVDHGVANANNQYCATPGDTTIKDNYFYHFNEGTNTALSSFSSFILNNAFAPSRTVAVLPRGFGLAYYPCTSGDHHLVQLAYNLDYGEIFADKKIQYQKEDRTIAAPLPNPGSRADSGFVSWNAYAILKDNDTRRDYIFAEIVSGMGGNGVGVFQPPFSILPAEDYGPFGNVGCGVTGGAAVTTNEYVIENIPFDMLYLCSRVGS